MFRRFPPLFNYSIKDNIEPKLNYFVVEMGRDLKELKEFPQYFSFSLENRIKPRHQSCVEKSMYFPLRALLKTNEEQFRGRLDVCCNSSMPLSSSPLSCISCHIDSNTEWKVFIFFMYLWIGVLCPPVNCCLKCYCFLFIFVFSDCLKSSIQVLRPLRFIAYRRLSFGAVAFSKITHRNQKGKVGVLVTSFLWKRGRRSCI